jgi:hypothetical protein
LSAWLWLIVILGGFALLYALSVGVLLAAGRREEGRATGRVSSPIASFSVRGW